MNVLDIVFLILIGLSGWNGFKKGFVIEIFGFLALFVGLYAGILFSDWLSRIIIEDFGSDSKYVPIISFAIIYDGHIWEESFLSILLAEIFLFLHKQQHQYDEVKM